MYYSMEAFCVLIHVPSIVFIHNIMCARALNIFTTKTTIYSLQVRLENSRLSVGQARKTCRAPGTLGALVKDFQSCTTRAIAGAAAEASAADVTYCGACSLPGRRGMVRRTMGRPERCRSGSESERTNPGTVIPRIQRRLIKPARQHSQSRAVRPVHNKQKHNSVRQHHMGIRSN